MEYMDDIREAMQNALNQETTGQKQIANAKELQPRERQQTQSDMVQTHAETILRKEVNRYRLKGRKLAAGQDNGARHSTPQQHADTITEEVRGMINTLRGTIGTAPQPKYNWRDFTYTDGSLQTSKATEGEETTAAVGAGVYDARTEQKRRTQLPGNASINEAELAAIYEAVLQGATEIATDSLTSMQQINKQIHRPQDHKYHTHRALLEEIAKAIAAASHLVKVKSHIGIVGNEVADELAKEAATHQRLEPELDTMDEEDEGEGVKQYVRPGSGRTNMYWPVEIRYRNGPEGGGASPDTEPRKRTLNNLATDLKQVVHKMCRLGAANRNTIYFSSWQQTEMDRDVSSYHMMHTDQLSFAERATALRYRTGTMYTAKQRYRFNLAPSSDCVLCGQPDGGHHTCSGCPSLSKCYTHRHNKVDR
jgi:ribonuclease HI